MWSQNTLNKAFKSDSQRLAVSLRSSIAKRRSHLNAALYFFLVQCVIMLELKSKAET